MKPFVLLLTTIVCLTYFASFAQDTESLPDIMVYDLSNRKGISASKIWSPEKVTILITYSESWCIPCMGLINNVYNLPYYQKTDFQLIALNVDDRTDMNTALPDAKNLSSKGDIKIYYDINWAFMKAINKTTAPVIFFIDTKGKIVYSETSFNTDPEQISRWATSIFNGQMSAARLYYDENWKPTSVDKGVYYRSSKKLPNGNFLIEDFYKSGKIQYRAESKRLHPESLTGEVNWFYENGQKSESGMYVKNMREDLFTTWYEDGTIRGKSIYKYNLLHGEWKVYHKDGKTIKNAGVYVNGKPDAVWYHYHQNGTKFIETNYSNGKKNGLASAWYEDGKVLFKLNFVDNDISTQTPAEIYYPNGKLYFKIEKVDLYNTKYSYYLEDGRLARQNNKSVVDKKSYINCTFYQEGTIVTNFWGQLFKSYNNSEETLRLQGYKQYYEGSGKLMVDVKFNNDGETLDTASKTYFENGKTANYFTEGGYVGFLDQNGNQMRFNSSEEKYKLGSPYHLDAFKDSNWLRSFSKSELEEFYLYRKQIDSYYAN